MLPKKVSKKKEDNNEDTSCLEYEGGFTIKQLMVDILLLIIIVVIVIVGFKLVMAKADRITLQHDLENFVKAQDIYRADHKCYLGKEGDFIEYGKPPKGTLAVPDFLFSPSENIKIVITSGNGNNYMGPPPFVAMVKQERSSYIYEYDFSTCQTTERKK